MANATPSEFALFQKLANPQKTDFSKTQNAFKNAVQRELSTVQQPKPSAKSVLPPMPAFSPPPARPPPSAPSAPLVPPKSTKFKGGGGDSRKGESDTDTRSSSSSSSSSYYRRRDRDRRDDRKDDRRDTASSYTRHSGARAAQFAFTLPGGAKDEDVEQELRAEVDREKQGYLLELMKYKEPPYNIKLTREYTMNDPLEVIQFECDRIKANLDTVNNVAFIRDTAIFAFQGIELANHTWGPVLQLDGWADSVKEDKERYNHVIERLYKKHWRYGNMSPESELAWLLGSSMIMHHLKMKYGGGVQPKSSGGEAGSKGKGGGGFGGLPKFDLASMMGGLLPSLGGMAGAMGGGGGAAAKPVMRPPSSASPPPAPTSASSSRPVMRGPSFTGAPPVGMPATPAMPPMPPMVPPGAAQPSASFGTIMGPPPVASNPMMRPGDRNPDVDVLTEARRAAEKEIREMHERARNEHSAMQREMQAMRQEMRSMQMMRAAMPTPQAMPSHHGMPNHQAMPGHHTAPPPNHQAMPSPAPLTRPFPGAPNKAVAAAPAAGVHFDDDEEEEDDDKQISLVGAMNRRGRVGAAASGGLQAAAAPKAVPAPTGRAAKPVVPLKLDLGAADSEEADASGDE